MGPVPPARQAHERSVISIISADAAEKTLGRKTTVQPVDAIRDAVDGQIFGHIGAIEGIRLQRPGQADIRHVETLDIDAVVRRTVGECLVYEMVAGQFQAFVQSGVAAAAHADVLQIAATDQATHGMGYEIDAERLACCRVVAADPLAYAQNEAPQIEGELDHLATFAITEIARRLLVVAKYPDALGGRLTLDIVAVAIGVGIAFILHQTQQR